MHPSLDPRTRSDWFLDLAKQIEWMTPPTVAENVRFDADNPSIRWYEDGVLNVTLSCLDRHLAEHGDKTALIWEADEEGDEHVQRWSYRQLHEEVCKLGNAMRNLGVQKGDRVALYMPLIPQAAVAMLACARIGAIHSVVFGGFSAEALADRLYDSQAKILITADVAKRGGKTIALKSQADIALALPAARSVETVIVVDHDASEPEMKVPRDRFWHHLLDGQPTTCPPEPMQAEDPLFILYTSGSTGKPKGIVHSTGGYLVWATHTLKDRFTAQADDVHWCTADVGWITGHSYVVYAPLACGLTTVMHEGTPTYPDAGRWWRMVERHQVNLFYTAPTAIRSLMRHGDDWVRQSTLSSLRVLGSVGEPINPEAWHWYFEQVGQTRCPIIDTWWQTETGGFMIAPRVNEPNPKPGAAMTPLDGIDAALVDVQHQPLTAPAQGHLVIRQSWPSQARTIWNDHTRFAQTYFSTHPGCYFTGDGARLDEDGHVWITGRVDDVINISGHRLGTAEIESALTKHANVVEAAVVPVPDDLKGQGIHAFVITHEPIEATQLLKALNNELRTHIGAIAALSNMRVVTALPKTRSGKIMRRILRKIAEGKPEAIGDTSTLADPSVLAQLLQASNSQ